VTNCQLPIAALLYHSQPLKSRAFFATEENKGPRVSEQGFVTNCQLPIAALLYHSQPLKSRAFFATEENKEPRVSKQGFVTNCQLTSIQTNKCFFYVIFASLTSNILGSRQNIKNLFGNF